MNGTNNFFSFFFFLNCLTFEIKSYFQGLILAGWSRYDHLAVLCELLPIALPTLSMSMETILVSFIFTFYIYFEQINSRVLLASAYLLQLWRNRIKTKIFRKVDPQSDLIQLQTTCCNVKFQWNLDLRSDASFLARRLI